MDIVKVAKWKRDFKKAWGKCNDSIRSMSHSPSITCAARNPSFKHYLKKSFTINSTSAMSTSLDNSNNNNTNRKSTKSKKKKNKVAPEGCFSVYVGTEKQRFVVRTEFANHPLFRMLLEDAESEYGYNSEGPILLPCEVDLFYKVLAEMENCDRDGDGEDSDGFMRCKSSPGCSLLLCSPLRNSHGDYRRLSPSRLLKVNNYS